MYYIIVSNTYLFLYDKYDIYVCNSGTRTILVYNEKYREEFVEHLISLYPDAMIAYTRYKHMIPYLNGKSPDSVWILYPVHIPSNKRYMVIPSGTRLKHTETNRIIPISTDIECIPSLNTKKPKGKYTYNIFSRILLSYMGYKYLVSMDNTSNHSHSLFKEIQAGLSDIVIYL